MLISRCEMRVEWGDCDPAGIVYFPRYMQWFDSCTARLFEAATGLRKYDLLEAYGIAGFPMVDLRTRFIIPSKFSDTVVVESFIGAFRTSSFRVEHRLLKDGELAVECGETRVWTVRHPSDPGRIKSAPIPEELKEKFAVAQTATTVPMGLRNA
jgi:4-hydroxybenzoyl-CoA thioesterase